MPLIEWNPRLDAAAQARNQSPNFETLKLPVQVTPRNLLVPLLDGTVCRVRHYPSPTSCCLVLVDAPDHSPREREDVALYISAFGAAQVYRLRDTAQTDLQACLARGHALLDTLVAEEPGAPILLAAFSTKHGLEFSFADGYFGARGGLPAHHLLTARDGARLALREYAAESETAVLILHGSTTHDATYAPLARFIAARNLARAFTLTLRGHGMSGGARGDVAYVAQNVDDVADMLENIRATTRPKRLVLLGHSLGGGLALRFIESRYASSIDGCILLAPYIGSRTPLQDRNTHVIAARVFWQHAIPLALGDALGITRGQHLPCIEFDMLPGFRTPMEVTRYSYRGWMAVSPSRRLRRALDAFRKPHLVVLSDGDELFVPDKLASYFQGVPQLELARIAQATHSGIAFHPETHAYIAQWLEQSG